MIILCSSLNANERYITFIFLFLPMTPKKEENASTRQVLEEELLTSLNHLGENIQSLDETLNLIREHEFVEFHKSKWKIFAYQILLGILFAMGTVLGLVLLSWMTYTFFKDSAVLRDTIDNQLKMRQFNIGEIREKAQLDAMGGKTITASGVQTSASGKTNTGAIQ